MSHGGDAFASRRVQTEAPLGGNGDAGAKFRLEAAGVIALKIRCAKQDRWRTRLRGKTITRKPRAEWGWDGRRRALDGRYGVFGSWWGHHREPPFSICRFLDEPLEGKRSGKVNAMPHKLLVSAIAFALAAGTGSAWAQSDQPTNPIPDQAGQNRFKGAHQPGQNTPAPAQTRSGNLPDQPGQNRFKGAHQSAGQAGQNAPGAVQNQQGNDSSQVGQNRFKGAHQSGEQSGANAPAGNTPVQAGQNRFKGAHQSGDRLGRTE